MTIIGVQACGEGDPVVDHDAAEVEGRRRCVRRCPIDK